MMLKLRQFIAGLMTATVLVSSTTSVDAKNPPKGVGSLGAMSCQRTGGQDYQVINEDFPVGLQIFRGIARFSGSWEYGQRGIDTNSKPVVCRLTQTGQKSIYKTLNLAFGIADNNKLSDDAIVRLSIYKNGNFYKYQDISKGQLLRWTIDVKNIRSIALEVECLKESSKGRNVCPALIFFEDTLQ
jgi:hypothetical protein